MAELPVSPAPGSGLRAIWTLRKTEGPEPVAYAVASDGLEAHCTCPDHEIHGALCKHIGALVALLLVGLVIFYFYLNSQLSRRNVLVDYSGRPAAAAGTRFAWPQCSQWITPLAMTSLSPPGEDHGTPCTGRRWHYPSWSRRRVR